MKKLIKGLLVIIAVVGLISALVACDVPTSSDENMEDLEGYAFVSVKAGDAEVEFVTQDNQVKSYYASNEEAEVLLLDSDLEGMEIDQATEEVVDEAIEEREIDPEADDSEIEIGAIDEEGQTDEDTYNKIEEYLNNYFENHGIFGRVSPATVESFKEKADELDLSIGHLKILMVAYEITGKSIDELKEMELPDVLELIHTTIKEQRIANGQLFGSAKDNLTDEEIDELRAERNARIEENKAKIQAHREQFNKNRKNAKKRIREFQENRKNWIDNKQNDEEENNIIDDNQNNEEENNIIDDNQNDEEENNIVDDNQNDEEENNTEIV